MFIALLLGIALGALVGYIARGALQPPPSAPAARAAIKLDPSRLAIQPGDVPADYALFVESSSADPGETHPQAKYGVVVRRKDEPAYLAESGVNVYGSTAQAAAALKTLLAVGKFGTELPKHGSLGEEVHLYASKDAGLVVASVLWRDRNAVAWIFLYNPYPDAIPPDQVDRLARANVYDDAMAYALAVEGRIQAA